MERNAQRFSLHLERDVIARLIPHRPPLALVDCVHSFAPGRRATLEASLAIDGSEAVLEGHFPGRALWPGAYVMEGLAQAAALLLVLQEVFEDKGEAAVLDPVAELDRTGTTEPPAIGVLASTEIKFQRPIAPPATLQYQITLMGVFGTVRRLEGVALLDGEPVASGRMAIAILAGTPT